MSAAQSRAALAAIGCDILALEGGPGERRAAALLDELGQRRRPSTNLADLAQVPDWLRSPRPAQRRVAIAVALLSMGPALSTAIDGGWLGRLADIAGEDVLDWAIERADTVGVVDGTALDPDAVEARGFSLLRALLPPSLRDFLRWAPGGIAAERDAVRADALVAAASEAPEPR